jgi:hypothetical protein
VAKIYHNRAADKDRFFQRFLVAQIKKCKTNESLNLLSPTIGDPICIPTQDMLIGLYVLMIGNR